MGRLSNGRTSTVAIRRLPASDAAHPRPAPAALAGRPPPPPGARGGPPLPSPPPPPTAQWTSASSSFSAAGGGAPPPLSAPSSAGPSSSGTDLSGGTDPSSRPPVPIDLTTASNLAHLTTAMVDMRPVWLFLASHAPFLEKEAMAVEGEVAALQDALPATDKEALEAARESCNTQTWFVTVHGVNRVSGCWAGWLGLGRWL